LDRHFGARYSQVFICDDNSAGEGATRARMPSSHSRQARIVGNPLHNLVTDDAEFLPTAVKLARA